MRGQEQKQRIVPRVHEAAHGPQHLLQVLPGRERDVVDRARMIDQGDRPAARFETLVEELARGQHLPFEDGLISVAGEPHEVEVAGTRLCGQQIGEGTLEELRREPRLARMALLRRGNRLSVQPVTPAEGRRVLALGGLDPAEVL